MLKAVELPDGQIPGEKKCRAQSTAENTEGGIAGLRRIRCRFIL